MLFSYSSFIWNWNCNCQSAGLSRSLLSSPLRPLSLCWGLQCLFWTLSLSLSQSDLVYCISILKIKRNVQHSSTVQIILLKKGIVMYTSTGTYVRTWMISIRMKMSNKFIHCKNLNLFDFWPDRLSRKKKWKQRKNWNSRNTNIFEKWERDAQNITSE